MAASWPFCLATRSFWQLWILLSYSQGNEWHSVGRIAKWILEVEESTLVLELRECNLVWNHTCNFKIQQVHSLILIWNHKYDFRPKLQHTKFNYILIISILKTQNSIPQLQDILLSSIEVVFLKVTKVVFLSQSSNLIGYHKKALKSDGLLCFTQGFPMAGKKSDAI